MLNTFWLMTVLFLPFSAARLFTETRLRTDFTVLYLATMLAISLLALTQLWWVGRHPRLSGQSSRLPGCALLPAAAQSATFAAACVTAVFSPAAGLLLLIAVPVVQYGARRFAIRGDRPPAGDHSA